MRSMPDQFAPILLLRLRGVVHVAVDALLPPRCPKCGVTVAAGDGAMLCAGCWPTIAFLGPPLCACCGLPFPHDTVAGPGPGSGGGLLCGACARQLPPFDRARSVMRYDEASRDLVLGFKHADRLHTAPAFGRWMARAGGELLQDADLLMPVPLHWTRLFKRRYNQAALLAQAVRNAAGGRPAVAPDWMVRRRRTISQGDLGAVARERNVRGAFALRSGRAVDGLRIVLVDDVLTTGATAMECARVLKRAGAARVDVLTLARAGRFDA